MNLRIEKFRILTKYNCCFRLLKTQIQIQPSAIFKMNIWLLLTVEEMRPQVVYNIDRSSLSVSAIPRYEIVQIFFCKTFEEVTFRKSQTLTEKNFLFSTKKRDSGKSKVPQRWKTLEKSSLDPNGEQSLSRLEVSFSFLEGKTLSESEFVINSISLNFFPNDEGNSGKIVYASTAIVLFRLVRWYLRE